MDARLETETAFSLDRMTFGVGLSSQEEDAKITNNPPAAPAEGARVGGPDGSMAEASEDLLRGGTQPLPQLVDDLAQTIAQAILRAMRSVGKIREADRQTLEDCIRLQGEAQQATSAGLAALQQKLEQLTELVSTQQSVDATAREKCEQLAAAIESIRQADAVREAALLALRTETQELSAMTSNGLDSLAGRVNAQQQELSKLTSAVASISSRIGPLADRVERHAEAIRGLYDLQERWKLALVQLNDVLAGVKAGGAEAPSAVAAADL